MHLEPPGRFVKEGNLYMKDNFEASTFNFNIYITWKACLFPGKVGIIMLSEDMDAPLPVFL